ncbi:MAG: hypothetical protein HQL59_09450 [Magnetococcales bacterium]|nr:hypothetical protein [Magnetococcales bacterium]
MSGTEKSPVLVGEALRDEVVPIRFQDLLARKFPDRGEFVRYMPNGRLPSKPQVVTIPEISPEEVQQRRQEALEREIYQKVFDAAEKAGMELGEEKLQREMDRLLPQVEGILRELDALPARVLAASERFLVESAILLVRELLAHELSVNPEGIAERVRRVMAKAVDRQEMVVRLSPGNAELLRVIEGFQSLRIEADANVPPGSVLLVTDFGGVEEDLGEQLRMVEDALREQLRQRLEGSGFAELGRQTGRPPDEFLERMERINEGAALARAGELIVAGAGELSGRRDCGDGSLREETPPEGVGRDDVLGAVAGPSLASTGVDGAGETISRGGDAPERLVEGGDPVGEGDPLELGVDGVEASGDEVEAVAGDGVEAVVEDGIEAVAEAAAAVRGVVPPAEAEGAPEVLEEVSAVPADGDDFSSPWREEGEEADAGDLGSPWREDPDSP